MDLAEDMIRFSGLEPGRDIAIEIIGRAPRREAARAAVQRLRAARADARAEDPARRPPGGRSGVGGVRVRQDRAARRRGRRGRSGRRRGRACRGSHGRCRSFRGVAGATGLLDFPARLHGAARVFAPGPGREVRRLRRDRRLLRSGHSHVALLRPGARSQTPARMGGPCARARGGARAGRRRARRGGAPRARDAGPGGRSRSPAAPPPSPSVATNGVVKLKPAEVAALAFARAAGVHEPHEPQRRTRCRPPPPSPPRRRPQVAAAAAAVATGEPAAAQALNGGGTAHRARSRAGDARRAPRRVPPPPPLPPRRAAPPRRAPAPPPRRESNTRAVVLTAVVGVARARRLPSSSLTQRARRRRRHDAGAAERRRDAHARRPRRRRRRPRPPTPAPTKETALDRRLQRHGAGPASPATHPRRCSSTRAIPRTTSAPTPRRPSSSARPRS